MTFELRQVALGAWHQVKDEAMSVDEALYIAMCNRGDRMA